VRGAAPLVVLLLLACGAPRGGDAEEQADAACDASPGPPLPGVAVALNAYFLQEEAARALRRGEASAPVVDEVLAKARALGVTVVRTNGFNDDPAKAGDSAIQVAPLAYDEVALRGLDLVLARAAAHGVRLVLPLGNFWSDYGGTRQYVAWAGLPAPRDGDPRFFSEPSIVDHYREHVRRLLERRSAADGLRYAEHPAVLAWELLNEPRGEPDDASGAAVRAWVDELGALVKRLAPGHLVGTGEEGLEAGGPPSAFWALAAPGWLFASGTSFRRNVASPWVDYGSAHLFPESWGIGPGLTAAVGARWIAEHARAAREVGKPLLVGELGLRNDGAFGLAERGGLYRAWLRCAARAGAAAAPWLFANDARPDGWDPHTFHLRDGTLPADPVNRYADVVLEAAGGGVRAACDARRPCPAPPPE
jgi:mannan endo-1,4-beta-mannosidase